MKADLNELDVLAAQGCRFVRVSPGDKRPLGTAWQSRSTDNVFLVTSWLQGGGNVGLLLGPASGVVDVEFDSDAGREQLAAFGILDLRTPTWRSHRGEHRLFRWEPWMPPIAVRKAGDIEVRLGFKAAQSVLPPSTHPEGVPYQWVVRPSEVPIALFPAQLLAQEARRARPA